MPLVNSTAPGSTFIIRSILFSYTKIPKIFAAYFLSFIYLSIYHIPFNLVTWPPRDWQPLVCVLCTGLRFVCRWCLRGVAWFSYWIDNLGFLTKGNTYSTVLHHPLLFGDKNPTQSTSSRKNFWRRCRGDIVNIIKYLHSQLLPLHLLYLPFASRFPLPHF